MADFKYSANVDVNLNVKSAATQLKDLQNQLKQISNMDFNLNGLGIAEEIAEASKAALELQSHLKAATNISTGNLDFTKLNTSLKQSGISLEEYGRKLIALGPEGQKAFMNLSTAISQSEIQMTKSSKLLNTAFDNLKKTVGWQISSSIVNSFAGSIQRAVGYAQDLNKSLTDIRIVTGASTEQMTTFAREANKAAKNLSTTTTDYTKASLIYYQQGLSDAEVKARTETTIKMANATGTSAQKVSDQMTAIWNNYDNGTKSLTHYADVMTALGAATASSTDEIAEGLQKFASISDTVGLSYEYAASALATITSTSRESADVVGNSLKTLFSRIQGLQLGETLDDGTTLNKYSTAMAKVGISIKDSSGELKSMDSILDEMGTKWQTLANDEKMALAQTVAGVRQYTQLMTLMENWDEFKQNVNIANTSGGTLDKQAEIYAQSWEAASNRMRAAFEGLWDNLINDDAVIGIMDFFSGVISGIDGLVSALGGAGGTLLSFGSIFTRIFGDNIAQNIKEISSDIYKLTPKYREKQQASKQALINELKEAQSDFGYNSARSKIFEQQSKKATGEDVKRQQRRELLSDTDKEIYDRRKAKVDAAREAQSRAAEKIDISVEGMADAIADNYDVLNLEEKYHSKDQYDERKARIEELEEKYTKEEARRLKDLQEKNDRNEDEEKELRDLQSKRTKEEEQELNRLKKQNQEADKDGFNKTRKQKIQEVAKQNNDFLEALRDATDKQDFEKAVNSVYGEDSDTAKILKKNLETALQSSTEGINSDVISTVAKKTTDRLLAQVADGIEYTVDEDADEDDKERRQKAAQKYAQSYANHERGTKELEHANKTVETAEGALDEPLPSEMQMPVGSWASTLVEGAEGIMEVTAAGQALGGVMQSVSYGTATLSSTLIGLASGGYEAASGLSSLQSAFSQIPKLAGIAGPLSLAITAIATLGPVFAELFDMFNTSAEEFSQSIARSTENLQNAANDAAQSVTTLQEESKTHLETVKQIESYSQDPATMANEIYEANKQAIDMISKYGQKWIEGKDYTVNQDTGLIKISESSLKNAEEQKTKIATDFERTSNLAASTEKIEEAQLVYNELFNEFKHNNADIQKRDILEQIGKASISQLQSWQENGTSFSYGSKENMNSVRYFSAEEMQKLITAYQQESQAESLIDLISQQNTRTILEDQGFNSQSVQGFDYLNKKMADEYAEIYKNTLNDYVNSVDTVGGIWNGIDQIDEDQKKLIKEYLELQGHYGIEKLKYRSGEIQYYSDDTEGQQSIEWEDVKRWKAEQEASKDSSSKIKEYQDTIEEYNKKYGGMSEAILSIEEFDSVAKTSADSVRTLYKNYQQYQEGISEGQENLITDQTKAANDAWESLGDEEQSRINEMFGPDSIVENLGLDDETLKNTNWEVLESLKELNDFDANNGDALKGLFESIKGITGETDPEGLSKILTALSSMNFSENAYLNATNLLGILEDLGYSVSEGSLPAIYAWLCAITGLSPGSEDFEETNKSISEKRGALNGIEPGGKVDTAAKEAAEDAGLRGDWVKSGEDEYTYTGTQEQIDAAKDFQNKAWADNQMAINTAQKGYSEAQKKGLNLLPSGYKDISQLTSALGLSREWNKDGFYLDTENDNGQMELLAEAMGIDQQEFKDKLLNDSSFLDQVNTFLKNGSMSDETQSADAEDFMTNIDSAEDMMDAVNQARERGDTEGFIDANGIMSEEAIARAQAFEQTSERTAHALDVLEAAQARYAPRAEEYATAQKQLVEAKKILNDENASEEDKIQALEDEAEAQQVLNDIGIDEAQQNYELQQAIDATAEARGLDAEAIALQAETIRENLTKAGVDAKGIAEIAADTIEAKEALDELNKSADTYWDLFNKISKGKSLTNPKDLQNLNKMATLFNKIAGSQDLMIKDTAKLNKEFQKFLKDNPDAMQDFINGSGKALKKWQAQAAQIKADEILGTDFTESTDDALDALGDVMAKYSDEIDGMKVGESLQEAFGKGAPAALECAEGIQNALQTMVNSGMSWDEATDVIEKATDFEIVPVEDSTESDIKIQEPELEQVAHVGPYGEVNIETTKGPSVNEESPGAAQGNIKMAKIVKGGGSGGSPGGGGGGGGGGKEPKKVANKRKSQTVKRYKKNDFKRSFAEKAKKSEENKRDYLYGESKITQMEKINKLAEKEARITSDRIKESQKYLEEDRQNLIKYMRKYGFEAEFDSDGFLSNYEETWTKLYEELAALYEDNELTEDEEKLEEEINIKLEELEGALEDYENSLKELADDIEAYEESLYEMYDNKVEALEHKVEFKIELEEDDMAFLDFWIESLGDSLYNALEAIEAMGAKANHLFDGLEVYKQGIEDIYSLSDDPFQAWVTGSLNTDILTQDQVDMLRDNRDGLIDYAQQLVDLREEIKDKVIDTFDSWTERIDASRASLEHYTAVIEHFKNIIDIVGQDPLGLNDAFMDKLEQSAINQSMDHIESNKAYYESLVEQQAKAQEELDAARARGDKSSEEHWEEVVRTTTEAMETAQEELLTSLEDTLNLIAEQFETSMQRAVDAFNDAIYSYGGLEGLSNDYSMAQEYSSLMAQDYQKIYELNKINRNINKTLSDSNIIAGKQKMVELQKEINALQASNVELSQYDLEYLQAKYELRLAEIELENSRNNKDTVRLSKDSEGNWSYVYTQNMDAIDEAQQKYEDALYNMQNLSYEYMEEMSSAMVDTSISMMEELQNLRIQDFDSYEEYAKEVQRIQDKYGDYLSNQENELNKSVSNNKDLYNQDWQNYSEMTGYKISESQLWADNFSESTLGVLMNSDSMISDFANNILSLSDIMINSLGSSALQYFGNVETVLNKYGTSIAGFGSTVNSTVTTMSTKSKSTSEDIKSMAQDMKDAFIEIADVVSDWQEEFSQKIDDMLTQISSLIQEINEAIRKSAELTSPSAPNDLIGTTEAIELLNKAAPEGYDLGEFSQGQNGQIIANGTTYQNWLDYNASLVEEIDKKIAEMASEHTGTDRRKELEKELAILFVKYHAFKDIVGRIYDAASGSTVQLETPAYSSFDTGGYTGDWGDSGKLAMLHEKELILNKQDTENFLNALNISRDLINNMIEMNARASSMGFGNLVPTSFQENSQTLEQQVTITAEFPNATNHDEIEEAFNNLINTASQYANRYNL